MAKSKGTTGNSNTPVSKFEELLETSIKINNNENDKYKDYFDYVEALYNEWKKFHDKYKKLLKKYYPTFNAMKDVIPGIKPLLPPQFFTGDIESNVVVISLNGHAGEQRSEIDATEHCDEWKKYKDFWTKFVDKRYGEKSKYKDNPVSEFDKKLHRFLSGCNSDVKSEDLAKWKFFHMELCPFLSSSYRTPSNCEKLKRYLLRALEAIALKERDIVIVLNNKVCDILDEVKEIELNEKLEEEKLEKEEREIELKYTTKDGNTQQFNAHKRIYKYKSKNLKKPIKIIAVPTFAYRVMKGELIIRYNKFAFSDEDRMLINKAIGVK